VVEDEADHQELILESLRAHGHDSLEVIFADTVAEACRLIQADRFAFVVLDHNLPDGTGIDILNNCENELLTTPVIGLSTTSDPEIALSDFRHGAVEFVLKHNAFKAGDLGERVYEAVAKFKRKSLARSLDANHLDSITSSTDELIAAARTDALTGLPNRRTLDEVHRATNEDSVARGAPYCFVLIDVDNFKLYNDTYGHPMGDRALIAVAEALVQSLRDGDMAARMGGEEFGIVLPDTDLDGGIEVAQRICEAVSDLNIEHVSNLPYGCLSVSAGVAVSSPKNALRTEQLVDAADSQLYLAKQGGRNTVCSASNTGPGSRQAS
jgi:diguanylate cyclase (GGDEF)-like protein